MLFPNTLKYVSKGPSKNVLGIAERHGKILDLALLTLGILYEGRGPSEFFLFYGDGGESS